MAFRSGDLDALLDELRRRDNYSLPFEIRPIGRGQATLDLAESVNLAIGVANQQAEARVPFDPTWCTEADLLDGRWFAEIQKGSLDDDEVRAWLLDLDREIDARGLRVRVGVHKPRVRVPNIAEWYELPSALSAFLYFTSTGSVRAQFERTIDLTVVQEIAAPLIAWSRVPSASLVIRKGLTEGVVPESRGEEVLLEGLPDEPQFGLWRATTNPRRLKHASFSWAHGDLQVLDPTAPHTQLQALLDGLRTVSPHLDYASVRRSMASAPSESDAVYLFRRELTYLEQQLTWGMTDHLLADYVPDAHVAQVLTDSHLAKAKDLSLFHIEPMGKDRHLVRARDTEPWINDATPSEEVRDAARSGFGDMLLTEEFLRAHPPT